MGGFFSLYQSHCIYATLLTLWGALIDINSIAEIVYIVGFDYLWNWNTFSFLFGILSFPWHSITVTFFAREGEDCNLIPTKENLLQPVIVHFERGLGQKFRQPSGTGIDFSSYEYTELLKVGEADVYPLAVKAEASQSVETGTGGNPTLLPINSQLTQAVFLKDEDGVFKLKVLKQVLWVNGMSYELQEIFGIGNSVDGDVDGNDPGKECVICLSEPRDTTVLPCRHMVILLSYMFLFYMGVIILE